MLRFITKWWNILLGRDKNWDGEVDIKDKLMEAKEKANES